MMIAFSDEARGQRVAVVELMVIRSKESKKKGPESQYSFPENTANYLVFCAGSHLLKLTSLLQNTATFEEHFGYKFW